MANSNWEDALIESVEFDENSNILTITQQDGNAQSVVIDETSNVEWAYF
ncbi:hypothetical protein [Dysgonomonas termitidis]|uniref:Uncharacterized protein n=1 Tax=Dysgonomonas termitidis TaxID=1516126 RepID=A0ABV9KX30_9BACT